MGHESHDVISHFTLRWAQLSQRNSARYYLTVFSNYRSRLIMMSARIAVPQIWKSSPTVDPNEWPDSDPSPRWLHIDSALVLVPTITETRTFSICLPSTRQHPSYGDCLQAKREYYQNIRTALRWIVWHSVHSPQHTYVSSSYRSNRLGLSHWDPYAVRRGGCLELYYCNMVGWFWWGSSLISTTNWFPSVLWHCWFGHLACKNRPRNNLLCVEWDVKPYTLISGQFDTVSPRSPFKRAVASDGYTSKCSVASRSGWAPEWPNIRN